MGFRLDEAAYAAFLLEPVRSYVERTAEQVADLARELAPVGLDDGGLLKSSIHTEENAVADGFSFSVIANPVDPRNGFHYGYTSSRGHREIFTESPMSFFWAKHDVHVFTTHVNATSGDPYLELSLNYVCESVSDPFVTRIN